MLERKRSTVKRPAIGPRPAAQRWRSRAWFSLAAVVGALAVLAVGGVGWRALENEEAAVARELTAQEEQYARSAASQVATLLDEEARAALAGRPVACGVADVVQPTRNLDDPAALPTSAACADRIARLPTVLEPRERGPLRDDILRDCPAARSPSGRLVAPMLLAKPGDADALVAWLGAHQNVLGPHDRATLRAMIEGTAYDAATVPRLRAALRDDGSRTHGVAATALLADPAVAAALTALASSDDRGPVVRPFQGSSVVGRVVRGEATSVVVAHEGSLRACAAARMGLPSELVLVVEHGAGDGRKPSAELAPELRLRFATRTGVVADRTRRSRRNLALLLAGGVLLMVLLSAGYAVQLRRERKLSELRVDFLAAVSHELRTPVASLRMLTELLVDDKVPADDREEVHQTMARETRRLSETIERMLDFRRLLAGAELTRAPLAIVPFVRELVSAWAGEAAVPVSTEVADDVTVYGDAAMLRLMLHNLLDNARKYAGGPTAARISATARTVELRIEDRGPGVPSADLRRIFEPFERSGDRLSEATEGTGIGLAIVRHVAEGHGGEARAEPRPGGGTVFVVTLLRSEEPTV